MKRAWTGIKNRAWALLPLLLAGVAFLAWVVRLSSTTPRRVLELERQAIDAGEKAKIREAEVGRDKANAEIDHEYNTAIAKLDAKQSAKADRLRRDPGARVRLLNRLSSKSGG